MLVIGIDPGTLCGWCVINRAGGRETVDSGTWSLKGSRYEGGGMRFVRLRSLLSELLQNVKPEVLAFEEVRGHKGVDAAHVYGGIVAVLTEECERRGIPYGGVPVATAKKYATGKGNANKEAMTRAAAAKWPGWTGDDNEADARWIATCAMDGLAQSRAQTDAESVRELIG